MKTGEEPLQSPLEAMQQATADSIVRYDAFEDKNLASFIQFYVLSGELLGQSVFVHTDKIEEMLEAYLKTREKHAN